MEFRSLVAMFVLLFCITLHSGSAALEAGQPSGHAGSASCRECHERFHTLWSTSRHRQTIRPYTDEFAKAELLSQKAEITISSLRYRADVSPGIGRMVEIGPEGVKEYRIEYVLGGKGLYSFLTTLEDGRIEALPLAYDIVKKEWYDAENSVDSPLPEGVISPGPIYWNKRPFTFSEACPSCHVSNFSIHFDPTKKKKYAESWNEPGVNCETCHGPSLEHNRAMRGIKKDQPIADTKIISTKRMTTSQRNDLCATCHAKQTALTGKYVPGDRYFDHFDLTALENPDFYPDGRDHGENFTLTNWLMSPCVKSGKLDCIHCHTSSGRYRFKAEEKANDACMPCHAERVANAAAHSRHKADGPGSKCVSCHMPKTSFARMKRSDHSMRPPTPAATMEFKSPNACTLCHDDKDAAWADKWVRTWHPRDYQAFTLKQGRLVAAARKGDWTKLPEILDNLQSKDRDEIFTASLIRLLRRCGDERVSPVLLEALKDPSPLVRAAAAESLGARPSPENADALLAAAKDDYRLVRIKAAASLWSYPRQLLSVGAEEEFQKAREEYVAFLLLEPDNWETFYTIGNHHLKRDEFQEAIAAFQKALEIKPRAIMAMLNLSYAQARLGARESAVKVLADAIRAEPDNLAAKRMTERFGYGKEALEMAEDFLSSALEENPKSAQAAYGLCALAAENRLAVALKWCQKAVENDPGEPKYALALARNLERAGQTGEAASVLEKLILNHPGHAEANLMFEAIHQRQNQPTGAEGGDLPAISTKGKSD